MASVPPSAAQHPGDAPDRGRPDVARVVPGARAGKDLLPLARCNPPERARGANGRRRRDRSGVRLSPVAILASGMVTGVGFDAASSSAAMRVGITGFVETRFMFAGEWLIGCPVPFEDA